MNNTIIRCTFCSDLIPNGATYVSSKTSRACICSTCVALCQSVLAEVERNNNRGRVALSLIRGDKVEQKVQQSYTDDSIPPFNGAA